MTPMEAIQSATSDAAAHMGLAEDVGTIAPGKAADLIAMRSDPLKNRQAFRQVDMVMKSGKIVKSPPSVTIAQ